MPGIVDGGFVVDGLCPGANVVHGPNGIGKSTLCRALHALLWRESAPKDAELDAEIRVGGATWQVQLANRAVRWTRDDGTSAAPLLAAPHTRDRYYLSLHELLSADDRAFADAVLRETAGGYDVAGAATELGFRAQPPRPAALIEEHRAARQALEDALRAQRALADDERELPDLRKRRDAAEGAGCEVRALDAALACAAAGEARQRTATALAGFPPGMARILGNEGELADGLASERAARLREAREQRAALMQARESLAAVRRLAPRLSPGAAPALTARLNRLSELRAAADTAGAAHAEARGRLQSARHSVLGAPVGAADRGLTQADVADIAAYARRACAWRAERQAAAAMRAWLGLAAPEVDLARLRELHRLLARWLAAPDGGDRERVARRLAATAGAIALLIAGVALAADRGAAWAALALPALALLAWGWWPRGESSPRAALRTEVERLGEPGPAGWTEQMVGARLRDVEAQAATAAVSAEHRARLAACEAREKALAVEEEALAHRWADLRGQHGAYVPGPLEADGALSVLVEGIARLRDAEAAERGAAGRSSRADEQSAAALAALNEQLARAGMAPAPDAAAAAPAVDEACELAARLGAAERAATEARVALARIARSCREPRRRRRELYRALALRDGDRAGLGALLGDLPAYREAVDAARHAERARDDAIDAAVGRPDLLALSPEELRGRRATQEALAAELADLAGRIGKLEADLERARTGADAGAALARLQASRDALRDLRAVACANAVGWMVAQRVAAAAREGTRPRVFHRARSLYAAITAGRYRLEFDDGDPPRFRAVDTTLGRSHELDELSSGSRLQLLLAVRVAFVEEQESGPRLPVLLDEAMANSDDERAAALIDGVIALCRGGRQVIYLTAQSDEVERWRTALGAADVASAFVDLGAARGQAARERLPRAPMGPRGTPPAPDGRTREEYAAALGVPGIDWTANDAGGTHLWHLVTDLPALHALLSVGIQSWGQLRTLVECGGCVGLPEGTLERAAARARALEAAGGLWRVGRGRPVDAATVRASGAVGPSFEPAVCELAERLGGDARALLAALQDGALPWFRSRSAERLRAYLAEHGYLDERAPLGRDEVAARVLAAASQDLDVGRIGHDGIAEMLAGLPG